MSFANCPVPPDYTGYVLTVEKLDEWDVFHRFLAQNPDIQERYAAHKTYEILKDDNRNR